MSYKYKIGERVMSISKEFATGRCGFVDSSFISDRGFPVYRVNIDGMIYIIIQRKLKSIDPWEEITI